MMSLTYNTVDRLCLTYLAGSGTNEKSWNAVL